MTLVRTSLLNGIAVVIKVASAAALNKILAVYVGPMGYAVIGQFQNAVAIAVSFAGGLFATGVTQKTAQHFDDESKQRAVWRTAIKLSLGFSILIGAILFFSRSWLSNSLLHRPDMSSIFIWLAAIMPAMAANSLLLAIVNGKKEVGTYVAANIAGSISSLLVVGMLAYYFGLYGALVAFVVNPAVALLSTVMLIRGRPWLKLRNLWGGVDRPAGQDLAGFAIMAITSAIVVPATHMLVRDHLVTRLGFTAAGYWQASWKISEIYLTLVTATLSVYYLPRIAEIREMAELRAEIFKVYRVVLPLVVLTAMAIYLLRDPLIHFLFTDDFYQVRDLFAWQLAGDVIKTGSWILGYILIGRAMVKAFVITELIFALSFYLLSWLLVGYLGLIGVSAAYAINYFLHWLCMTYLVMHGLHLGKANVDA